MNDYVSKADYDRDMKAMTTVIEEQGKIIRKLEDRFKEQARYNRQQAWARRKKDGFKK